MPRLQINILILLLTLASMVGKAQSFSQYMEAGLEAYQDNYYELASEYFESAHIQKENADAKFWWAKALFANNEVLAAHRLLKKVKLDKDDVLYQKVILLEIEVARKLCKRRTYLSTLKKAFRMGLVEQSAYDEALAIQQRLQEMSASPIQDLTSHEDNTSFSEYLYPLDKESVIFRNNRFRTVEGVELNYFKMFNAAGKPIRIQKLPQQGQVQSIAVVEEGKYAIEVCITGGSCDFYWAERKSEKAFKLIAPIKALQTVFDEKSLVKGPNNTFYFASNRPEGEGGFDIYTTVWNGETFTEISKMPFNTIHDEIAPFYDDVDEVLYFSANGVLTFGGFDVFAWESGKLKNLGQSINSCRDDLFFSVKREANDIVYHWSSNRLKNKKEEECCLDIYQAIYNKDLKEEEQQKNEVPLAWLPKKAGGIEEDLAFQKPDIKDNNTDENNNLTKSSKKQGKGDGIESQMDIEGKVSKAENQDQSTVHTRVGPEKTTLNEEKESSFVNGNQPKEKPNAESKIDSEGKIGKSGNQGQSTVHVSTGHEDINKEKESINGTPSTLNKEKKASEIKTDQTIIANKTSSSKEEESASGKVTLVNDSANQTSDDASNSAEAPKITWTANGFKIEQRGNIYRYALIDLSAFNANQGLTIYFNNDMPDSDTYKTTTSSEYETTFLSYLNQKNTFTTKNTHKECIEFFNSTLPKGYAYLSAFRDYLLKAIQNGKSVTFNLSGSASIRSNSEYNINLSKRRINNVLNYLKTEPTIKKAFEDGRVQITENAVGELESLQGQSATDGITSIYGMDAILSRKVMISSIQIR